MDGKSIYDEELVFEKDKSESIKSTRAKGRRVSKIKKINK